MKNGEQEELRKRCERALVRLFGEALADDVDVITAMCRREIDRERRRVRRLKDKKARKRQ